MLRIKPISSHSYCVLAGAVEAGCRDSNQDKHTWRRITPNLQQNAERKLIRNGTEENYTNAMPYPVVVVKAW